MSLHSWWEPYSVRASSQCQQTRWNNMHGNKSIWVPLQQAGWCGTQDKNREGLVRHLHVKGSTSQPSRVAEGREQTTKIRKCHREHSRKVTALHRGVEVQETSFKSASWVHFLTKEIQLSFIGKGISGHTASSNLSQKNKEVIQFLFSISTTRKGPGRQREGEKEYNK